jgi:hypothetical protein
MDDWFSMEIAGALVLASVWVVAIGRLWFGRRWSPLRPVVMVAVITASLVLIGEAFLDHAAGRDVDTVFWLAVFNLYMALFDLRLAMALGRRGGLVVSRRRGVAGEERAAA